MPSIGQNIRVGRKAYGLSQVELGMLTGVSGAYISQLETDLHGPRLEMGVLLAGALGTDCYALTGAALPVHMAYRKRQFSDRCLLEFFGGYPSGKQITLTDLGEHVGFDRATVERRTKILEASGLLKITRFPRIHGLEGANQYEVIRNASLFQ